MNTPKPLLPTLKEEERSPMVDVLLEVLAWQEKRIEELEEELLRLKGETTKPNIKPSKMDQEEKPAVKPANGQKRSKIAQLAIDKTIVV